MISKGTVILLDKPAGLTSGQAVRKLSQSFGLKAGHTGTLDGFATGLLVVCLGEARKAIPAFVGLPKTYTGTICLHGKAEKKDISRVFKKFTGKITQIPPRKSAVVRKPRKRVVYSFKPKKVKDRAVEFEVKCEAGVYIRKLAHDAGEALGCGAHLGELRRTSVGGLSVNQASKITDPKTHPLEKILDEIGLPKVKVKTSSVKGIRNGAPVKPRDILSKGKLKPGDLVGIFSGNKIIAVGISQKDKIKTDRVFR